MAKGRRGNNEGHIRKRVDGRWEAMITLDNGKSKSFYGNTRQEVAERLAKALQEKKQGTLVLDERQTLGQYLQTWLESAQFQIRPSTYRRYRNFTKHLTEGLGKVPLAKLAPQQLQMLYARKLKDGLSTTTVHHMHAMLHRALKDAERMNLVVRNVTEMIRPPRRRHHEMENLTPQQAQALLQAVAGDRFEALYVLALSTGMRLGELLGLRWRDVDVEQKRLVVRMSVLEDGSKFILGEPKTPHSRRTVALSQVAADTLGLHRHRQTQEKDLVGRAWDISYDLVFPNVVGGIMIPDNLAKRSFKRFLEKAGLPNIRFHDLRHTAATLLLIKGVNVKVVSEMLGHSDISITLRIYAHVLQHMQAEAADVMDTLFG